jgi:hypothetical protein
MRSSKNVIYPDELTCDQMSLYKTSKIFQDVKKAASYAKRTRGQIYTQVDGDEDVVYSRGIHYVNRTGTYAVVKS